MDLGNEKHVCFINIFHKKLHVFALLLANLLWEIMFLLRKDIKWLPFYNSNGLIMFLFLHECFRPECMAIGLNNLNIYIFEIKVKIILPKWHFQLTTVMKMEVSCYPSSHLSIPSFLHFSIIIVGVPILLQEILDINDENKHMKFKRDMNMSSAPHQLCVLGVQMLKGLDFQ